MRLQLPVHFSEILRCYLSNKCLMSFLLMKLVIISLNLVNIVKTLAQHVSHAGRINNGTFANIGHFPFMVGLYRDEKTLACSGSLVAYQYILTAASCFVGSEKIQYAMAGDVQAWTFDETPSTGNFIKVINSTPHPYMVDHFKNHNKEIWNEYDVAILKTEKPFPENENIRTIEIEQKELDIGTHVVILGFGLGANSLTDYHRALSFLSMKIEGCPHQPVNSEGTLICAASTKGTSGNPGDKGGPLISKHPPYKLYGIFSDRAGQMNLVANAWTLQSWIKEQFV